MAQNSGIHSLNKIAFYDAKLYKEFSDFMHYLVNEELNRKNAHESEVIYIYLQMRECNFLQNGVFLIYVLGSTYYKYLFYLFFNIL